MSRWTLLTLATGPLLALAACTGPRGADGVDGINGVTGEDGHDGQDGQDGQDGKDGKDGVDGSNGADGNDGSDGTDGIDGYNGTDGQDGQDGSIANGTHEGDGPWGVHLELLTVAGATGASGQFQIGDRPEITFAVTDDDGYFYSLDELDGVGFQLAGPVNHYQIAIDNADLSSVTGTADDNGDGTYTFAFNMPVPSAYHAVPNDTSDLGEADGDYGGLPLDEGTYTLAAWAWIDQMDVDGNAWAEADDATEDVLVGSVTTYDTRDIASAEDCASCHGDTFRAHGGKFRSFETCLTCHVAGAEDLYSDVDATVTPGESVGMMYMVHKLHDAEHSAIPLELAGEATDSSATGYPDYNLYDYSDVVFPSWPMSAANCDTCHGSAASGDVQDTPTRYACGSCHDGIDFTQKTKTASDYHLGGVQNNDDSCDVCHSGTIGWPTKTAHGDPRASTSLNPGLNVAIVSVTNQDGATAFAVGDSVTVTYTVTYDDGTAAPSSLWAYSSTASTCSRVSGGATAAIVGPTDHMERVLASADADSSGTTGSVAAASTYDSTSGTYSYTFTTSAGASATIPSTVPEQLNGSADLGYDNWTGEDLPAGTYRVVLDLYTTLWDDPSGACTAWNVATSDSEDILVGGATTIEPRAIVTQDACEGCHTTLEYHDRTARGLDTCLSCHTAASSDQSGTDATVDLPNLIHRIHGSASGDYCVTGGTGDTCFTVAFPRFDGGTLACDACHDGDTWRSASHRGCMTCHDSTDAEAHASINTDAKWGEACDVCHGEARDWDIADVHAWAE